MTPPSLDVPWWRTPLDILGGLSTLALAAFAGVELWIRRSERQGRQRAADARVSAEAFALRRQLRSWLASENHTNPVVWTQEVMPHMDRAEARLHAMAGEAADGSPNVQEILREATARFYRGTNTLNEAGKGLASWSAVAKVRSKLATEPPADEDIQACADLLTKLIDARLETTDQRLGALWEKERPRP